MVRLRYFINTQDECKVESKIVGFNRILFHFEYFSVFHLGRQ